MAIKKADVCSVLSEKQQDEVTAFELIIDKELREKYVGDPLPISLSEAPSARAKEELIRRYQEAGWKIKFKDDQREGLWVEIS